MKQRLPLYLVYFLPNRGLSTKRTLGFPYTVRVPYLLTWKRIWAAALSMHYPIAPWFNEFYDPTHPSGALPLTTKILVSFAQEVRQMNKKPIVAILPTIRDFNYFKASGNWSYSSLIDAASRQGLAVFDLGGPLLVETKEEDLCAYFCTNPWTRTGHYTVQGNRILAKVIGNIMAERGL